MAFGYMVGIIYIGFWKLLVLNCFFLILAILYDPDLIFFLKKKKNRMMMIIIIIFIFME